MLGTLFIIDATLAVTPTDSRAGDATLRSADQLAYLHN